MKSFFHLPSTFLMKVKLALFSRPHKETYRMIF